MSKAFLLAITLTAPLCATVFTPTAFRINGTTTASNSACNPTTTSASQHVCDGFVLEVDVPTIATTGSFTLGMGTNNDPKNAVIILTVTSSGFASGSNCGSATNYKRTLYATHILREVSPNQATNDVTSNAGTTTFRFALGGGKGAQGTLVGPGYIFSGDTVTIQITGSFFTDGSGNTIGTVGAGTAVTNNSGIAYSSARAIFNWTYPGWQRVTGDFKVRGMGFSQFANNSLPLACVAFTASDAHTHSATVNVSFPTIDVSLSSLDPVKVTEYIATIPTGTFTNHDQITVTFKAYPWIGDSTAVMDSSDGTNSMPTPLYSKQYYLLDTTNNYSAAAYVDGSFTMSGAHTSGIFVAGEKVTQQTSGAIAYLIDVTGANGSGPIHLGAVVSGTWSTATGRTLTGATSGAVFTQTTTQTFAGNDTNSCAAAESGGQPATACRTINGALVKMAAFNNASSTPTHNDGCGTVFLEKGYYNWLGASAAASNTSANCWANLVSASGATQAQVVIDAQSGSQGFGTRCANAAGLTACGTPLHVKGLTVNVATNPVSVFTGITYLWMDQDSITSNGTAPFYQVTDSYWTWNAFGSDLGGNGLANFDSTASFSLIRGNSLNTVGTAHTMAYMTIGNTVTSSQGTLLEDEISSQGVPASMSIIAFNTFYQWPSATNFLMGLDYTTSGTIGKAVVQNIFESTAATDNSPPLVGMTADGSTATPVNNVMLWDNVMVGARLNRDYQDTGTSTLLRQTWAEIGNILDDVAIKADTFTGGTGANAVRTGNWGGLYGVGNRSNVYASTAYNSVAGTFCNEFFGLHSNAPAVTSGATQPPTCSTNAAANYPQYNNRKAGSGSAGAGNGDYRLKSNSPAINLFPATSQILPYDLAGQVRNNSGWGSAGAYEQAIVLTPVFGL